MTLIRQFRVLGSISISATLLLSVGCVVGPNFKKPAPPPVPNYTPTAPTATSSTPNVPGGESQSFVDGRDIPGDWWSLFHSQPLNDLIERSLKANPDLKSAQAALLVAKRKYAGAARFLLSKRVGRFFGHSRKNILRSFALHRLKRSQL